MNREEMWLLSEKYQGERTAAFLKDCARLKHGEPLAYIIGHTPFLDTSIFLDSRPLIPRSETEFWVSEAIKKITEREREEGAVRVLDLCAGSGCIGVAVKKAVRTATVDFVELDESHHPTIRKNLEMNGVATPPSSILGGDLFEEVSEQYDFILSNPPYIDPLHDRSETGVREYEPHRALYGGNKGIEVITRIVTTAPQYLGAQGILVIEHEPEQTKEIREIAEASGFACEVMKDQYGTLRYSVLHLAREA